MNECNQSRRNLIRQLACSGLLATSPFTFGSSNEGLKNDKSPIFILFEMFGANDNLNTLVPFKDPLYKNYRPNLGLKSKEYTSLSDELALNNALQPLLESWEQGELAIIQDVGAETASLSHFKAISMMENALNSDGKAIGWIANTISQNASLRDSSWDLNSVWAGGHIESLIGNGLMPYSPSRGSFSKYLKKYHIEDTLENTHILDKTINNYVTHTERLKGRVPEHSRFAEHFHTYHADELFISTQCTNILRFIEGGIKTPVYKIGMSGFDLHSSLRGQHEVLLERVSKNIALLRQSLIELDEWDNTIILTYSEFGRRPKENASLGTDHGSAGPMFLLGGKVKGGIKGQRAVLDDLNVDGNIKFKTDYHRVFSSVVEHWWKAEVNPFKINGYQPLDDLLS